MVFVRHNIKDNFQKIDHSITKLGLMGQLGNKGNLLIRFQYEKFTFALCCSHLNGKITNYFKRSTELRNILFNKIGNFNVFFNLLNRKYSRIIITLLSLEI